MAEVSPEKPKILSECMAFLAQISTPAGYMD